MSNYATTAVNEFAFDLYEQLAKENSGDNLFFSPYSISSVLTMAAEGARRETAEEMGRALRFPNAIRQRGQGAREQPWEIALIHTGMQDLSEHLKPEPVPQSLRDEIANLEKELAAIKRREDELNEIVDADSAIWEEIDELWKKSHLIAKRLNELLPLVDPFELRVANALFGEQTFPFEPTYQEAIEEFYGDDSVVPMDFIHAPEASRLQINGWVEEITNQRIRDMIPDGGVNGLTRLVLCNAIYFKGEWSDPFDESQTTPEVFTNGESKVSVPMMSVVGMEGARYAAYNADGTFYHTPRTLPMVDRPDPETLYPGEGGFLIAELPYKGGQLSMVLIVPQDSDGLEDVEKKLNAATLSDWMSRLDRRCFRIQLPKFKLETDYDQLDASLEKMGMERPFKNSIDPENGAQFDGICNGANPEEKLYITKVCHKAFLEVNEKGTEAAAATVAMMVGGAASTDEPFTPVFRVDKPFLFAIRDIETSSILFLGRIIDPVA